MSSTRTLAEPLELIDRAGLATDDEEKRALLAAAIAALSSMDLTSVKVAYTLGYAWYLVPGETEERSASIEKHLNAALAADPAHPYARLYLGHFFFDSARFAEALPLFMQFRRDEFAAWDQGWRDVKNAELILCCGIELADEDAIVFGTRELLERASCQDAEDVPVPQELTDVLLRRCRARTGR